MGGTGNSIYKPITERKVFRLLRLKAPKRNKLLLECQLVPVTFESTPNYSALSYVWGDAEPLKEIKLDGQEYFIRSNLHAALHQLREDWDILLWVDALCINQQDIQERNSQVTQMREIYTNAARVIACLGETSDDGDLAFDFMQKLSKKYNPTMVFADIDEEIFLDNYYLNKSWMPSWIALTNLIRRPYFRRVWIIQEIICAKHIVIQCGRHTLLWDTIVFCDKIMSKYWAGVDRFTRAMGISDQDSARMMVQWGPGHKEIVNLSEWQSKYAEEGCLDFYWLLASSTAFDATEAKDNIYGILGLASEETRREIKTDYGITPSNLFTDVTRRMLLEYGTFDSVPQWLSVSRGKLSSMLPS